ncbi:MAG: hypothetical protein AAF564_11760 [Bacteroidota bacterium]
MKTSSATHLYEIRDYHIAPEQLENYKMWITNHGLPHIRQHMHVVGFWLKGEGEAEVSGVPLDDLGAANVTWVIRWNSKEHADRTKEAVFGSRAWQDIFSRFPGGGEAYQRVNVRYFEGI